MKNKETGIYRCPFNSMKKLKIILPIIGVLLLFIIIPSVTLFYLKIEILIAHPVISQTIFFDLRWTHSVEKEDWEEFFTVKNNEIILTSTRFKTFGAGVPDHAGNNTFIKDGWVYMTGIHQTIGKQLVLQTGKTTNHRYIIQEKVHKLAPQQTYRITAETVPIYHIIYLFFINMRGEGI